MLLCCYEQKQVKKLEEKKPPQFRIMGVIFKKERIFPFFEISAWPNTHANKKKEIDVRCRAGRSMGIHVNQHTHSFNIDLNWSSDFFL